MTTNVTFLNDTLSRLQRSKEERQNAALQADQADGDITVQREKLRLISAQEENKFNPLPGTMSNMPFTDKADNKGPTRFDSIYFTARDQLSKLPTWAIGVAIAIGVLILLRVFKRG